ncbi:MAG TPA: spore coat protein U domain-containing protein [Treponemataceae bacterium]|nr:MAG: Spore Coat Protein U domain protein [Spirochaetes bacterium ADurb.Bin269]HOC29173.1 spore coat protein U domain-containing protein [Treponemataceae bacterium]HQL31987.1 spore coat protein U domain-containing protein [Treponemataceae bacterium]
MRNTAPDTGTFIHKNLIAALLLACVFTQGAFAAKPPKDPVVTLKKVDRIGTVAYGVDSGYESSYSLTVQRKNPGSASFFITVDGGLRGLYDPREASNGSSAIGYQIYDNLNDRNIIRSGSGINFPNVLTGIFSMPSANNESLSVSFAFSVPAGQPKPAGTYTDTITFTLYQGTPNDYDPASANSVSIDIAIRVEPSVSVVLAPAGGAWETGSEQFNLDLQTLTSYKQTVLSMVVKANIGYLIQFNSTNRGALVREGSIDELDRAPYTLAIDNAPVNLSIADSPSPLGAQSLAPDGVSSHILEITLGNVDTLRAGTYADAITVTVTAN